MIGDEPKTRGPYRPQRRRVAGKKPSLALQDRDLELLHSVWANRFLTRSLLLALFPPDPTRAPAHVRTAAPRAVGSNLDRRLRKLFHHGYLDRLRPQPGEELVYALGQRGAELLRTRQPELPLSEVTDWAEKNRDVGALYIGHALMVARFRVALESALARTSSVELARFDREHRDLKAEWQARGTRLYVNPDAFLTLHDRDTGRTAAFFLEADRSTMTLARLAEKFSRYAAMYRDRMHQEAFGIPTFRVLTVAKSRERASNLLKLVAGDGSPVLPDQRSLFFFTTEEAYAESLSNVLAAVWRSADNPDDLRGIIPSPLARIG